MKDSKLQDIGISVYINDEYNYISVDDNCIKFGEVVKHNRSYPFKETDPNYDYLNLLFNWAYFCELVIANRPAHPNKYIMTNPTSSSYEARREYSESEVDDVYEFIFYDSADKYNMNIRFKGKDIHLTKNGLIDAYRTVISDPFYSYILNELVKYYDINLSLYFPHLTSQVFIKSAYDIHKNSVRSPYILKMNNGASFRSNLGYARYIYANATPSQKDNITSVKDLKITEKGMFEYIGWADIRRMLKDYSEDDLNVKEKLIEIVRFLKAKMDETDCHHRKSRMSAIKINPFNKAVSFKIYKY